MELLNFSPDNKVSNRVIALIATSKFILSSIILIDDTLSGLGPEKSSGSAAYHNLHNNKYKISIYYILCLMSVEYVHFYTILQYIQLDTMEFDVLLSLLLV